MQSDGRVRPIYYAHVSLNPAQQNYTTTEREALAIIWALDQFHSYISGYDFEVYTDHEALRVFREGKALKGKLARWALAIQEYIPHIKIFCVKGKTINHADGLSRAHFEEYSGQKLMECLLNYERLGDPFAESAINSQTLFDSLRISVQRSDRSARSRAAKVITSEPIVSSAYQIVEGEGLHCACSLIFQE
jgi:hypothetical protein